MKEHITDNKERETVIDNILKCLVYASIGELRWVYRRLSREFSNSIDAGFVEVSSGYISLKEKIKDLQAEKAFLDAERAKLEESMSKTDKKVNELHSSLQSIQSNYERLQKEREESLLAVKALESEKTVLVTEKEISESEKAALARELERVGNLYEELTGKQVEQENLSKLLSLYITLMEEVFSSKTHFKILSIMHGGKKKWHRKELVKTTGIAEIEVRKALGELARAELIDYDEETTISILKKRITSLS